ncbi:hypothetical protein PFY12_14600 [Chryseobacterium camelliae]|uniref:Uncharacterized protein n=1 Tax=Chryseobacterium camelliae TaxID=1265445 RepID=A0ABY7QKQ3_9FLAO|nr:hypothetical protein [Chryseobacterium camelliae]WBV60255.1 hypothetical protein PFY12_14600 [Chryseobacterium camelliae]
MPKNENGEIKCVNHPEQTMNRFDGEAAFIRAELADNGNYDLNEEKLITVYVHCCPICGYIESYLVPSIESTSLIQ